MAVITDEQMNARLEEVTGYTAVFLRKGPTYVPPDTRPPEQAAIVREHGRRNMQLSADGKLAIVGPIHGDGSIVGLCIFSVPEAEVRTIMDADVAVQASIFTYDVVTFFGFRGDALPPA